MEKLLKKETQDRLRTIKSYVKNLWKENTTLPYFTFHDHSHNEAVEKMIYKLIPEKKWNDLNEEEWFCLLSAVWLHDLGMILNLNDTSKSLDDVRKNHHIYSAEYIARNSTPLGLSPFESDFISKLCKYHRKKTNINDLDDGETVRLKLLAAYLRLADVLHIDQTRVGESLYKLLVELKMPWESRFHWIKSKWVKSVIPNHESMSISFEVVGMPPDSNRHVSLEKIIKDEIEEELNGVKDILFRGGISWFSDVKPRALDIKLDGRDKVDLEIVLGNLELEHISSASEVFDSIINSIIRLSEVEDAHPYRAIKDYIKQLEKILSARPCHTMTRKLITDLRESTQMDDLPDEAKKKIIMEIKARLESEQKVREDAIQKLSKNATPLLNGADSIFLFGYSSLVLEALKTLLPDDKKRIEIIIGECRGKTIYNQANEIRYCDGLNYATKICDAGFSNISIIPDSCVANLMAREKIGIVVFGANGIDYKGNFGHTTGHLAIAIMAKHYKIPVYVIADSNKYGKLEPNLDKEREIRWLTNDKESLQLMKEKHIATQNPREDIIEPEFIDKIVTEIGVFSPCRIPESIVKRK